MNFLEDNNSLQESLRISHSLKDRATYLLSYCCYNKIKYWKECPSLAEEALQISKKINDKEFKGLALLEIGYQLWFSEQFDEALLKLEESSLLLKETKNYFKFSRAAAVHASILWSKGDRKKAISEIFNGLRSVKLLGEKQDGLWLEWFLGIFYFDLKDFVNAEKQYLKSLEIISTANINVRDAHAYCLIGYGGVLLQTSRSEEALDYFLKAKLFCEKHQLWMQEARVLNDLGNYYFSKSDFTKATEYYKKSYEIRLHQNTKPALITTMIALSKTKVISNKIQKALEIMVKALEYSKEINSLSKQKSCHNQLAKIYKELNKINDSIFHSEQEKKINQLLSSDKINSELKNVETAYVTEYLEQERLNLSNQNEELKKANLIIQKQFKEISDSIRYAKRIQRAILPAHKLVKEYLCESFILYLPKDIVAGDFYWMETIKNKIIFAVADCTGHGVPGAMISVVCNNALNRTVREFGLTKPNEILNQVRSLIIDEFKNETDFSDGMDISLCSLDIDTNELNWAGANSPLWIIKNADDAITEIKGDRQPIGCYPLIKTFTNHKVQLEKGDLIYLFTDGYADQFGGVKYKKFLKSNLRKLLLENRNCTINEQKEFLFNQFMKWKGEEEQIDDVCMIGVRI